jgi:hypothetical protein
MTTSVETLITELIDNLNVTLNDAIKHDSGNNAAGTRVRKAMQALKTDAQSVRIRVQHDRNS